MANVQVPASLYERKEWAKAQSHFEEWSKEYDKDWYWARDGDDLAKIAAVNGVTEKQLADFNWGTKRPKEINWYLREYCGCVPSSDESKFIFEGKPCLRGIWIPIKKKPAPTDTGGGERGDSIVTLDTPVCPSKTNSECPPPTCKSNDKAAMLTDVDLGKRWADLSDLIKELLEAGSTSLWLNQSYIFPKKSVKKLTRELSLRVPISGGKGPSRARIHKTDPDSKDKVGTLAVVFNSESVSLPSSWSKKDEKKDDGLAQEASPISWSDEEKRIMPRPYELESVAKHIEILKNAGAIARLVVRGYASAEGSLKHNKKLSEVRAKWVIDKLKTHFRLNFEPEIQVVVAGCGERFSKQNTPKDRVVVIEVESKEAAKSEEKEPKKSTKELKRDLSLRVPIPGPPSLTKIRAWTYREHEFHNVDDRILDGSVNVPSASDITLPGSNKYPRQEKKKDWTRPTGDKPGGTWKRRTALSMEINVTSATATTVEDAEYFRKEARRHLRLFSEVLAEVIPNFSPDLSLFNKWIGGWDPLFPGGNIPILHFSYKANGRLVPGNCIDMLDNEGSASLEVNLNNQTKNEIRRLANEGVKHDVPPLIVHFNVNEPRV